MLLRLIPVRPVGIDPDGDASSVGIEGEAFALEHSTLGERWASHDGRYGNRGHEGDQIPHQAFLEHGIAMAIKMIRAVIKGNEACVEQTGRFRVGRRKGPWMSTPNEAPILLFSYGTLQQANVQVATFGRLITAHPDELAGFVVVPLEIADAKVVAISGAAIHTIARHSGNPADVIRGVVFEITPAELEAADSYEVSATRVEVELASGAKAFAYVSRKT